MPQRARTSMRFVQTARIAALLAVALAAGCTCPWPKLHSAPAQISDANDPEAKVTKSDEHATAKNHKASREQVAEHSTAAPADMIAVLDEVQRLGALNPAAQQRLIGELKQVDPSLWPLLVASTKASLESAEPAATLPMPKPTLAHADPGLRKRSAASTTAPPTTPPTSNAVAELPQPKWPAAETETAAAPAVATTERTVSAAHPVVLASAVQPIAIKPEASGDFQQPLAEAIRSLERQTERPPTNPAQVGQHVYLRMLYLAAGRREDAMRPIAGLSPAEQEFWTNQLYGMASYMDAEHTPDVQRRVAEASQHFASAQAKLSELANLTVRNLSFCSEVSSYGVVARFEKREFKAAQQVLLYAEVDNFVSDSTRDGYHTALKASYQILDNQGRRVAGDDFGMTEETCLNRRRDFFVRYFLYLPKQIYAGKYTLQLSVEDVLGKKVGQSSIDFTIVDK